METHNLKDFGVEITKLITLSTAHIKPETARRLDTDANNNNLGLCVYAKEGYGYYIAIDNQIVNILEQKETSLSRCFPEELKRIILFAAAMDCTTLCLDCDGPECEFLPTYDWDNEESVSDNDWDWN